MSARNKFQIEHDRDGTVVNQSKIELIMKKLLKLNITLIFFFS